jgi:tyrosinase
MTTQARAPGQTESAPLMHRKSVDKLTLPELDDLRLAFGKAMTLNDERSFWYFAGWHGEPFGWCEHHTDYFLPWHRAYLYYLELALQSLVPGVTLPWWDWTSSAEVPAAYADEQTKGSDNPLLVKVVKLFHSQAEPEQAPPREPGTAAQGNPPGVPPLPYKDRWDKAMEATTFAQFQSAIEAIHDDVHVWVGGIMRDIRWAAYDPLFFAHHVMIDRAWRIWQHQNPGATPRFDLLDTPLRPNGMTVRQTLNVHDLGYEYAGTAADVPGNV